MTANIQDLAGNAVPVITQPQGAPLGYQQLTSVPANSALTVPAGANFAMISCETQSVRWRDDGIAPTASVGMLMAAGGAPQMFWGNLSALLFIQTSATAVLNISYYK